MPKKKIPEVFVSYSRHDEALIKPLAAAIAVGRAGAVFVDVEQLKAGHLWETEIVSAVRGAKVFVLCWCCEAAKSRFIAKEIKAALEDESRMIVPVLLCKEKLPVKLRRWQWIDLRGKVVHTCGPEKPKKVYAKRKPRTDRFKVSGDLGETITHTVTAKLEPAHNEPDLNWVEWDPNRVPSKRALELAGHVEVFFKSLGK